MKILLDEIFQAKNLIEVFIWNTEGHTENQEEVTTVHEYILVYALNIENYRLRNVIDPNVSEGSKIRRDFAENSITKNTPKNPVSEISLPVGFPCEAKTLQLAKYENLEAHKGHG